MSPISLPPNTKLRNMPTNTCTQDPYSYTTTLNLNTLYKDSLHVNRESIFNAIDQQAKTEVVCTYLTPP